MCLLHSNFLYDERVNMIPNSILPHIQQNNVIYDDSVCYLFIYSYSQSKACINCLSAVGHCIIKLGDSKNVSSSTSHALTLIQTRFVVGTSHLNWKSKDGTEFEQKVINYSDFYDFDTFEQSVIVSASAREIHEQSNSFQIWLRFFRVLYNILLAFD